MLVTKPLVDMDVARFIGGETIKDANADQNPPKPKSEPNQDWRTCFGMAIFICFIAGVVLFALYDSSGKEAVTGQYNTPKDSNLLISGIVCMVLMLILAITACCKYNKNPE